VAEDDYITCMKKAIVTGITGQDGSYLTEFLIEKGYEVHGIIRRASLFNTDRIDHLYHDRYTTGAPLVLHYGDLVDSSSIRRVLEAVEPAEFYNLGAQSHVKVSFEQPMYTSSTVAMGALGVLDAIHGHQKSTGNQIRFYQAGSSEMFGAAQPPQHEGTPFYPRSPYGVSKVAAHWFTVNYREAYNLFACNGILFNHESPRRGETFVTRKVTRAVARISLGLQEKLFLGNLDAKRDWGFAGDYVEAMWLMLQQDVPHDYVVATGEAHSVREFVEAAFDRLDMDWSAHVDVDPRYFRPTEVDFLEGDATKAREDLGWQPKVRFDDLVTMMVEHDLELARQEKTLRDAGHVVTPRGAASG